MNPSTVNGGCNPFVAPTPRRLPVINPLVAGFLASKTPPNCALLLACNSVAVTREAMMRRMDPTSGLPVLPPEAAHLMREAVTAHQRGALARADRAYRELVAQYPRFADAWHYYGLLQHQRHEARAALECLRQAQALRPDHPPFLVNFARVLYEQGEVTDALAYLEQARGLAPEDPQALVLQAQVLLNTGRGAEVVGALETLLARHGGDWQFWMLLGDCREQAGDRPGARAAFAEACSRSPAGEIRPWLRRGECALTDADVQSAEQAFNQALEMDPRSAQACLGLANLAVQAGNFERTASLAEAALKRDPRAYVAWGLLAGWHNLKSDEEFRDRLEAAGQEAGEDPEAWPLHFALGSLWEHREEYDRAFAAYARGNHQQGGTRPYAAEMQEAYTRHLIEGMDEEFIARGLRVGIPDPGAIFICGMPRSGTTLVEAILASHKDVNAGGEMRWMHDRLRRELGTRGLQETGRWLKAASVGELTTFAQEWRAVLEATAGECRRVTDKMPGNYHLLGLIHVCFPGAAIVYVHRDPRDNGLSCFTTAFEEGHAFSNALNTIGRHYLLHERLMDHWRKSLGPQRIIEVQYEALVRQPEVEIRRLLAALGLQWDPACLAFHRGPHRIRTASVYQARRPLYASSVGRWRRFAKHLGPLLEALSASPPL